MGNRSDKVCVEVLWSNGQSRVIGISRISERTKGSIAGRYSTIRISMHDSPNESVWTVASCTRRMTAQSVVVCFIRELERITKLPLAKAKIWIRSGGRAWGVMRTWPKMVAPAQMTLDVLQILASLSTSSASLQPLYKAIRRETILRIVELHPHVPLCKAVRSVALRSEKRN